MHSHRQLTYRVGRCPSRRSRAPCYSSMTSLRLQSLPLPVSTSIIICDTSNGAPRPFVPSSLHHTVFNALHSLSHPGVQATQQLIMEHYVWPGMKKDIKAWTRTCQPCQRSKVQRHTTSPFSAFPTPDARFDWVQIDIVGPLPPSHGQIYMLTCIDRFTRWPEAFPIPDMTAETVALTFASGWIARCHQLSQLTVEDSLSPASLLQLLGCRHLWTTAYHPIANGIIECFHRQLKAALKAHMSSSHWTEILSSWMSLKTDLQCSAAELVYGTTLRVPGQFFSAGYLIYD